MPKNIPVSTCSNLLHTVTDMTEMKHELSDYSIYECVLEAANKQVEALVGVEVPFLSAWPMDPPEGADDRMIRISFEDDYLDQIVEGEFQIHENILKGIAKGRDEDLGAFVEALLPIFRPGYVQAVLRRELHLVESEWFEDQQIIDKFDAYDLFLSFDTAPWTITDLTVQGIVADLFRVEFVFQNEDFAQYAQEQAKTDQGIDYDQLILPVALTWDEFVSATEVAADLTDLLKRIHRDFLVLKGDLKGRYSDEADRMFSYLDALAEGDEARLTEDPFMTGELVCDDDGRVHFSSDIEK